MKIPAILWIVSLFHSNTVAFSWTTTTTNRKQIQRRSTSARCPPSFRLAVSVSDDAEDVTDAAQRIYSLPALYDLAFGYRDFEEEVQFLLQTHEQVSGSAAKRILDVAAGPARHAITALSNNNNNNNNNNDDDLQITCVDLSPQMAKYAQEIALEELNEQQRSNFRYVVDDIRTFEQQRNNNNVNCCEPGSFDTAWILLGSLQHLTRNEEVVQCFSCILKCLKSKGTVILELPHPRETFTMVDCTRNEWKVPLDGSDGYDDDDEFNDEEEDDDEDEDDDDESVSEFGELRIIWGDDNDPFDPITQVRQLTIEMKVTSVNESEEIQSVKGTVPTRLFTAQEINALAALAGLNVVAMYGALQPQGVSINDPDAAFRLVCVLQKP